MYKESTIVITWLLIFAALLIGLTILGVVIDQRRCKLKWAQFETKFEAFTGCLVKPQGKDYFIPDENYRETN